MEKRDPSIAPFQFDRVFRLEEAPRAEKDSSASLAALQAMVEELEAALDAARQELDQAVGMARAEGLADGLEQARGERAEAQLAATDALHAGFDDLNEQMLAVTEHLTRNAAEVALCAAEMLAGHAVMLEPGRAFDEALGRALQQVAFGTTLIVCAHPDSMENFAQLIAARRDRQGAVPIVTLIEDDAIAPNDAQISWAQGGLIVDAEERRTAVLRELSALLDGDASETFPPTATIA